MLICIVTLFAGCSTATHYTIYYKDGSRGTEYQIAIDQSECETLGLNPTLIMEKIRSYAVREEADLRTRAKSLAGVIIQHGFSPDTDFTYNFAIKFSSFEAYCGFYGITEEDLENIEPELEYGLFVTRQIVQRVPLVDSTNKLSAVALGIYFTTYDAIYQDFRDNICGGSTTLCDQLMTKIKFNIIKCFPYTYGYRSNADAVSQVTLPSGLTSTETTLYSAHLWSGSLATPSSEILVYRNYCLADNRIAWYTLAIIITAIFGAILTLVLCSKQNKHPNAKDNTNNNFNDDSSNSTNSVSAQISDSNTNFNSQNIIINNTNVDTDDQNSSRD